MCGSCPWSSRFLGPLGALLAGAVYPIRPQRNGHQNSVESVLLGGEEWGCQLLSFVTAPRKGGRPRSAHSGLRKRSCI